MKTLSRSYRRGRANGNQAALGRYLELLGANVLLEHNS